MATRTLVAIWTRYEGEHRHHRGADAQRHQQRLVGDPVRQRQREERGDLGWNERERAGQDGCTEQTQNNQ